MLATIRVAEQKARAEKLLQSNVSIEIKGKIMS
jgi:hypothetical protein